MYVQADGEKVRDLCGERTAGEIASLAVITRDTLRRVERNGGPIRVKTARAIGRVLDVDPRTFAKSVSDWRSQRV